MPLSSLLKKILPQGLRNTLRPLYEGAQDAVMAGLSWLPLPRLSPTFLILGVQKGGTTTLYDALCQHPQIKAAARKEVHYFTTKYGFGPAWYRAHFPIQTAASLHDQTGEASPGLIYHPEAAARVKALLPNARFIVLLREPAARAISHYGHARRLGRETLSLPEALAAEPKRLRAAGDWGYARRHFSYLERGDYAAQLARWFHHFPREQFFICRSEDFFADPQKIYAEILAFLRLPAFTPAIRPLNMGKSQTVDPALRADIAARVAPFKERLQTLLGKEFTWHESA